MRAIAEGHVSGGQPCLWPYNRCPRNVTFWLEGLHEIFVKLMESVLRALVLRALKANCIPAGLVTLMFCKSLWIPMTAQRGVWAEQNSRQTQAKIIGTPGGVELKMAAYIWFREDVWIPGHAR